MIWSPIRTFLWWYRNVGNWKSRKPSSRLWIRRRIELKVSADQSSTNSKPSPFSVPQQTLPQFRLLIQWSRHRHAIKRDRRVVLVEEENHHLIQSALTASLRVMFSSLWVPFSKPGSASSSDSSPIDWRCTAKREMAVLSRRVLRCICAPYLI